MNEKENESLVYEVGFHLLPTIDESLVLAQSAEIKNIIEESGGLVLGEEAPKMVALSYDISKTVNSKKQNFSKAYFGWVKFEMESNKIAAVKTKIENCEEVLRFLIIKTVRENTLYTPKAPMFRKDSVKDEKEEEHVEKPKASAEEIDKSIDDLVIEN